MSKEKFYVTMVDTFLSYWGKTEGKKARYVYECDSIEKARIVAENAKNRTDQKEINILTNKPCYNKNTNYVQFRNEETDPNWYEKDYFKQH